MTELVYCVDTASMKPKTNCKEIWVGGTLAPYQNEFTFIDQFIWSSTPEKYDARKYRENVEIVREQQALLFSKLVSL